MKRIPYMLFVNFALVSTASAVLLRPGDGVDLHGWHIEYSSAAPVSIRGAQKIIGEVDKEQGDFSSWIFRADPQNPNEGFEAILNRKAAVVLFFKPVLEAGGPFLKGLSSDGSLIALDFGTGPTIREFEVWNSSGHKLLTDSYLDELRWEGNILMYAHPENELDIDLNEKTRACRDIGGAWLVKQKRFSGQRTVTVDSLEEVRCSN